MSARWSKWLPYVFLALAALSRWPGLFPQNFSAFYGLAFCAGAFFPRGIKWWLPLGTLVVSDLALNLYYYFHLHINPFTATQLANYAAFAGIVWFGTRFSPRSSLVKLLAGGVLGAIVFYLITNTAAWLANPEYTKDLAGWIIALTTGTKGHPTTLEFFRNTLTSGGLFTGLFAGAMKLSEAREPAEEKEAEEETAKEPEEEAPAPAEKEAWSQTTLPQQAAPSCGCGRHRNTVPHLLAPVANVRITLQVAVDLLLVIASISQNPARRAALFATGVSARKALPG